MVVFSVGDLDKGKTSQASAAAAMASQNPVQFSCRTSTSSSSGGHDQMRKAGPAMGASASTSLTSKLSNEGENQRIKYASSTMQGCCIKKEDALAVELDLDALKNTSFFGVYDGHGGAEVAMYCARRFHIMLREDKDYFNKLPNAIISVYSRLDDDLQRSNEWRESLYPRGNGDCFQFLSANLWPSAELPETTNYVAPLRKGSTACVVIIRGNHIIVGNLGDSRCVLSENGQAFNLSIDHKPNIQPERLRIERAGGRVLSERVPFVGPGKKIRRFSI
uniref:protein-serine/threonine phosphatase n=1 Tax=Oryza brachyantha TaxID=4533 RepID=J3LEM0_ORYBR